MKTRIIALTALLAALVAAAVGFTAWASGKPPLTAEDHMAGVTYYGAARPGEDWELREGIDRDRAVILSPQALTGYRSFWVELPEDMPDAQALSGKALIVEIDTARDVDGMSVATPKRVEVQGNIARATLESTLGEQALLSVFDDMTGTADHEPKQLKLWYYPSQSPQMERFYPGDSVQVIYTEDSMLSSITHLEPNG